MHIEINKDFKILLFRQTIEEIISVVDQFIKLYPSRLSNKEKLDCIFSYNLWIFFETNDEKELLLEKIEATWGPNEVNSNIFTFYFLCANFRQEFDIIRLNLNEEALLEYYQKDLYDLYGRRNNMKFSMNLITYSITKCIELLTEDGKMFINCPAIFATHKKFIESRKWLIQNGSVSIDFQDCCIINFYNNSRNGLKIKNNQIDFDSLGQKFEWGLPTYNK